MGIFTKTKKMFFAFSFLLPFWQSYAQYVPIQSGAAMNPAISSVSGMYSIGDEKPYSAVKDGDGNIYIAGNYDYDNFIMKVNASGAIEWNHKIYGGSGGQGIRLLFIGSDNNIHIVTSNARSDADFDPGAGDTRDATMYFDVVRAVYSPSGAYLSHQKLTQTTGSPHNPIYYATHDSNDDIYLYGYSYLGSSTATGTRDFDPGAGTVDIINSYYLVKYSSAGDLDWYHTFSSYLGVRDFAIDDSGLYITGEVNDAIDLDGNGSIDVTSAGYADIVLAKYNKNDGSLLWGHRFGSPGTEVGHQLFRNAAGNFVLTGNFDDEIDLDPSANTTVLKTNAVNRYAMFAAIFTPEGSLLSAKRLSDDYTSWQTVQAYGIQEDAAGNYYFYGAVSQDVDFNPSTSAVSLAKMYAGFINKCDAKLDLKYTASIGGGASYAYADYVYHAIPLNPGLYVIGNYRGNVDVNPNQGTQLLTSNRMRTSSTNEFEHYWSELYAVRYCELPANIPTPTNAWPTYIAQGSTNVMLGVNPVAGASSYIWTVPTGFNLPFNGTREVAISAGASAVDGNISVRASNACGSTDNLTFAVTTGTKEAAPITLDDQVKTYGDHDFTLVPTSPGTGAITFEEFEDANDVITLTGNQVSINKAGTAKVVARIASDATYGDGVKQVNITVNKKPLLVRANDAEIRVGEELPTLTATYGDGASFGNALHFDGVNDEVQVPSNAQLRSISTELTVEAWVKLPNPSANQKIVGASQFFILGVVGGKLYPEVWDNNGLVKTFEAGTIAADTWTHLAFTYKANGNMIGYINGVEVANIAVASPVRTNASTLTIGQVFGWRSAGTFDEIRIWNIARSAEEINATLTSGIDPVSAGLVAYYNFDHSAGWTLVDAKGNNGTLANFTLSGTTSNWVSGYHQVTAQSFIEGEDEDVLDVPATITTEATSTAQAGEYNIIPSGGSDDNYEYVFENGTLTINKNDQQITFNDPGSKVLGSPDFNLDATVTSGLPVVIEATPADKVQITGTSVKLLAAGEVTFTVSQPGNENYNPAESVSHTICISPAKPTISSVFDETVILSSSSTIGNNWYRNEAPLDFSEQVMEVGQAGTYNVMVLVDGCESEVSDGFVISSQSIDFGTLPTITLGDTDVAIEVVTTSTLPVIFSVSPAENATVNGNQITPLVAGELSIAALLSGDETHLPASVSTTICVAPETPVITSSYDGAVLLSSSSMEGNTWYRDEMVLDFTGSVLEVEEAGTYNVITKINGCQSQVSEGFVISDQSIEFGTLPAITVGDSDVEIDVTTTSTLPVTLSVNPSANATINGSTITALAAGEITITATLPGDETHLPASVSRTICIAPAKPIITSLYDGGVLLSSSSPEGNTWYRNEIPLNFTGRVLEVGKAGTYNLLVTIDGCESEVSEGVVISNQSIDFGILPTITQGDTDVEIAIVTNSTFPVTLSVSPAENATVNGNTITALAGGELTITASVSGDESHLPASVSTTVCINPAKPSIQAEVSETLLLTSSSTVGNVWYLDGNVLDFTGQVLEATEAGAYSVEVLVAGCVSEMSDAYVIEGQSIEFATLPTITEGDTNVEITVVTNSNLPVTFTATPTERVTFNGNKLSALAGGQVTITAFLAGNATHLPVSVSKTICIVPAKPTIELVEDSEGRTQLVSSSPKGNQWILNGQSIDGATAQAHVINAQGNYRVSVSIEGCSNTSDDFSVVLTGIEQRNSEDLFYPNPASDFITISTGINKNKDVKVYNSRGELVMQSGIDEKALLNLKALPAGMYLLMIEEGQHVYKQKMLKI